MIFTREVASKPLQDLTTWIWYVLRILPIVKNIGIPLAAAKLVTLCWEIGIISLPLNLIRSN